MVLEFITDGGVQMPDDRVIYHIDCNAFFASVEETLQPELRKVPMAVCGNPESRRGIILAKNALAKSFGVWTAERLGLYSLNYLHFFGILYIERKRGTVHVSPASSNPLRRSPYAITAVGASAGPCRWPYRCWRRASSWRNCCVNRAAFLSVRSGLRMNRPVVCRQGRIVLCLLRGNLCGR